MKLFYFLNFAPGKPCTTSSGLLPQGWKAARLRLLSGAMQVAYRFFICSSSVMII